MRTYSEFIEQIQHAPAHERLQAATNRVKASCTELESIKYQLEDLLRAVENLLTHLNDESDLLQSIKVKMKE